jgi:hypothetical protein
MFERNNSIYEDDKNLLKKLSFVWTDLDFKFRYSVTFEDLKKFKYENGGDLERVELQGIAGTKYFEINTQNYILLIVYRLFCLKIESLHSYSLNYDFDKTLQKYTFFKSRLQGLTTPLAKQLINDDPNGLLEKLIGLFGLFEYNHNIYLASIFENNTAKLNQFLKALTYLNKDNIEVFYDVLVNNESKEFLTILTNPQYSIGFFHLQLDFYNLLQNSDNYSAIEKLISKPEFNDFKVIKHFVSLWDLSGGALEGLANILKTYSPEKLIKLQGLTELDFYPVFLNYPYKDLSLLSKLGDPESQESDIHIFNSMLIIEPELRFFKNIFKVILQEQNYQELYQKSASELLSLYKKHGGIESFNDNHMLNKFTNFRTVLHKYNEEQLKKLSNILQEPGLMEMASKVINILGSENLKTKYLNLLHYLENAAKETIELLDIVFFERKNVRLEEILGNDQTLLLKIASLFNNQNQLQKFAEIFGTNNPEGTLSFGEVFAAPKENSKRKLYMAITKNIETEGDNPEEKFNKLKNILSQEDLLKHFLKLFGNWSIVKKRARVQKYVKFANSEKAELDASGFFGFVEKDILLKQAVEIMIKTTIEKKQYNLLENQFINFFIQSELTLSEAYGLYRAFNGIYHQHIRKQLLDIVQSDAVTNLIALEDLLDQKVQNHYAEIDAVDDAQVTNLTHFEKLKRIQELINNLSKFFFIEPFILAKNVSKEPNYAIKKINQFTNYVKENNPF